MWFLTATGAVFWGGLIAIVAWAVLAEAFRAGWHTWILYADARDAGDLDEAPPLGVLHDICRAFWSEFFCAYYDRKSSRRGWVDWKPWRDPHRDDRTP